jgi:hypothetical protein
MRLAVFKRFATTTLGERIAYPGVLTNAAAVLANGDPPDYRARADFPRPLAHANNAVAAALSLYKQALTRTLLHRRQSCTNRSPIGQYWNGKRNLPGGNHAPHASLIPVSPPDCRRHVYQTRRDYWTRPAKASGPAP